MLSSIGPQLRGSAGCDQVVKIFLWICQQRNMDLTPLIFGSVSTVPKEARGIGLVTVSQSLWDWLALVQNSALPSFSPVTCASFPPVVQQMVSVRP